MIHIIHGDDLFKSRQALNQLLDQNPLSNLLRLDSKSANLEKINQFLNSTTLLSGSKILIVENFFSLTKSLLDQTVDLLIHTTDTDIILWQDKKLTLTQLKLFPQAQVQQFLASRHLFFCLNAITPNNLPKFVPLYQKTISTEPFELFLYLVKNKIRQSLTGYSKFPQPKLIKTYLNLIDLEYQSKTGQLATPKDLALLRILTQLIQS